MQDSVTLLERLADEVTRCPYTKATMTDPVLAYDGYSFERASFHNFMSAAVPRDYLGRPSLPECAWSNLALKSLIVRSAGGSVWSGKKPPKEIVCPITRAVLLDPVVACDGWTYERSAIEPKLQRGDYVSPVSGETIRCNILVPNIAIQKLAGLWSDEAWRRKREKQERHAVGVGAQRQTIKQAKELPRRARFAKVAFKEVGDEALRCGRTVRQRGRTAGESEALRKRVDEPI